MFDQLLQNSLPTVATPRLLELRKNISLEWQDPTTVHQEFKAKAVEYFTGSKLNNLTGLDSFSVIETILGCNHTIDALVMQHGIGGLQVFEHDYKYYQRLDPAIVYAVPGDLAPGWPILMAMPSPGYLAPHPQQQAILDEALAKNCPVHLDCAWLGAARGINFDFSHPAIASVSMSLSKGMDMWWNRIGLRWTRIQDDKDPITIYNKHNMIHISAIQIGLLYLQTIEPDHVWNYYADKYNSICKQLRLRPTNIVHVMQSIDRSCMYGTKNLLENYDAKR